MDENDMNNSPAEPEMPESAPEPQPVRTTPRPVKKAKPKPVAKPAPRRALPKPKKAVAKPHRESKRSEMPKSALLTIYIILGVLALVTSFFVGYLAGKGAGFTTKTGSVTGDKLQIIEYSDYQCPFCGAVEPTVEQFRKAYGDKIEFVYKNFPLESIHPNAFNSAIAAECARDQGDDKFWAYHDKLFANQGALEVANLKQYASDLGLDTAKFNKCFDNKETESRVRADQQEGLAKGVQGTPSFWIKDELVVGAQPYNVFQQKIDEKLAGKAAAPAPAQPSAPAAPTAPVDVAVGPHVVGDANAKVTIVEFSDFQCPFCKRFFTDTEDQIMDQYVKTGKVKFSYRNFPLSFHQNAEKSAEAAECVAKIAGNDAYWKYHDVLFTKGNGDGTGLDTADLKQYAADLKIDTAAFNKCLDGGEMAATVQKDFSDGQTAGVSGTPSFYINGKQVVGAQPFNVFQSAIDAELK